MKNTICYIKNELYRGLYKVVKINETRYYLVRITAMSLQPMKQKSSDIISRVADSLVFVTKEDIIKLINEQQNGLLSTKQSLDKFFNN